MEDTFQESLSEMMQMGKEMLRSSHFATQSIFDMQAFLFVVPRRLHKETARVHSSPC